MRAKLAAPKAVGKDGSTAAAAQLSRSGTLPWAMVLYASSTGQTLALLATFLGIGVLVNVLIVYIVAQVLGERQENQERRQRLSE